MQVALNSYPTNTPTGLGTLARAMLRVYNDMGHIRWPHPRFNKGQPQTLSDMAQAMYRSANVIVALERPLPGRLFKEAKADGKKTVLIVMHEWLNRECEWLPYVDLFVCPNAIAEAKVNSALTHIRGDKPKVSIVRAMPPLDLESMEFHQRKEVNRFCYSHGWGGVNDRKGWPELRAVLELMPRSERASVYVNMQRLIDVPDGTLSGPDSLWYAYATADVAIVPSRCEGLGLGILEAMAYGLPVLTTCAEPMSEYIKESYGEAASECLLPVGKTQVADVWNHPVQQSLCDPTQLVKVIRKTKEWHPEFVKRLSHCGRSFVEEKCGEKAAQHLWSEIVK